MQARIRVLTRYRKPEVDATQDNDLNYVFKGVVTLPLQGGEGSVQVSSSPFFLWGISQEAAAESSASPVPQWAGPPSKPESRYCAVA